VSVSVLIADDQQLIRAGFRMILAAEPDIEVVGEATTGAEAVALTRELRPAGHRNDHTGKPKGPAPSARRSGLSCS
jgi:chemotaxis response regulator CheB